ncbi:response regulator transcription factor [Herbihabitans rhizosphaerae]|nr:response regulator transcription factor [Herbihabitans rhizosphaerae]
MDLLRAALVSLLSDEDDIEVVADVKHLDTVMPVARRLRPDVAVLADLPHPQCLSTVRGLRDEVPECGIVALIVTKPPDLVSHLIELEVGGLIDKDAPPVRLLQAIRKVADGESMIDTNLVVAALSATRNPLTPRERQTLQLAADGASGPEIAKSLALSPGTVRNYLSKAMCKTGGRTRIQAIQIATDAGWL